MQHANIIVMPVPDQKRKPMLRSEESPPYPEFAIEMLRNVAKTISEEISPIRVAVSEIQRTLGGIEHAVTALEAKTKTHSDKLESTGQDLHAAKIMLRIILGTGIAGTLVVIGLRYLVGH